MSYSNSKRRVTSSRQKRRKSSIEKNIHLGLDDDETRRSKSLDGDSTESSSCIPDHHNLQSKEARSSHQSQKVHKTPWSKVKDIIQTRTGSIKKKKGTESDVDEEISGQVDFFETDDKEYEDKNIDLVLNEDAMDLSSEAVQRTIDIPNRKRLAPVLTITLPSTEELRTTDCKTATSPATTTNKNGKPPPSPQVEDKLNRTLMKQKTMEEIPTKDHYKKQVSSSSAGTSPPTPRRKSKWSKVKNAFLTSTPSPEDLTAHISNSTPSSPINKCTSFLYDLESDELSSSEFIDENLQDNNDNVFCEQMEESFNTTHSSRFLHINTQKNLEDLHLRFSNEFHQKLSEWERIRNSGIGITSPPSAGKVSVSGLSSGTSSVGEEDKAFKRKLDEWDKVKNERKRESLALQQLGEENLSPDFKKKLEQWERIKAVPVSPTQESSPVLQPQSKKRITDWQRWRPGGSVTKSDNHSHTISPDVTDDFTKRLQDWDRGKSGTTTDPDTSCKTGNRTPSPGVSHDIFFEQKSRKIQHRFSETKEKWSDTGHKVLKSKSHHEMKELAWLEKELHKIEREKQRLERERDKYLEREARLQKMRRAIGSTQQKQEVVIPTSTGLFRFEGISQKFTKKLYEWEKARGIGPEASTIALLDPGYKPPSGELNPGENLKKNGTLLLRSKSMGSVVDIAGGGCQSSVITHQPSSLSLNNMEEMGNSGVINQVSHLESCLSDKDDDYDDYYDGDEPGAVIVDIEDVVEETASPLAEPPAVITEIPVYCYAPAEVTRLIDSSGSENELSSDNVQSSYCILQENIDLLDELKKKEDICRNIEIKMENLEEKMQSTAVYREQQLENLGKDEENIAKIKSDLKADENIELQQIKSQLKILEEHQEALKHEEETLQYSFAEHSEQQAVLAQNLVDNMRQLQEVNNCISSKENPDQADEDGDNNSRHEEALAKVQDLTTQLLTMAERLEIIVGERNKELWRLRETVMSSNTTNSIKRPALSQHSFSTDSITTTPGVSAVSRLPRQSSEELSRLPTMLTSKVLELKRGLTYLRAVSDAAVNTESVPSKINDIVLRDAECGEELPKSTEPSEHLTENTLAISSIGKSNTLEKEEIQPESKCHYGEEELVVACLTLPAIKFRKEEERNQSGEEVNRRNLLTDCTVDAQLQKTKRIVRSRECCSTIQNVGRDSDEQGSEINCESGQESTNLKMVRIDKQSSKGKSRRMRLPSKSNEDETGSAKKNKEELNIRGRRLRRDSDGQRNLKSKNQRDEVVLSSDRIENKDANETGSSLSMELRITEPVEQVFSSQTDTEPQELSEKADANQTSASESASSSLSNRNDLCRSDRLSNALGCGSAPVDVFVPTTRKIFSPVRRDSKGKTSSVISYIVRENPPLEQQAPLSPRRLRRRNIQEDEKITEAQRESDGDETKKDSINFVMPPCWILRETRAQSASPALQRRNLLASRGRDKPLESDFTPAKQKISEMKVLVEDSSNFNRVPDTNLANCNETPAQQIKVEGESSKMHESKFGTVRTSPTLAKKHAVQSRDLPGELSAQPIRKSRTEIGFPPISPIPGRREVKLSKETAPSIRMIIARYNQKVSESQEMIGSKSPDSGSGSPLPWRSPGAERRVRAQMERYQDEVRKALQGSEDRKQNFGEVKKSASASFIRPYEKGSIQDRFGRRPSDSLTERQTSAMRYNGILKSSSAGSIKPETPVPQRREATTQEKLEPTTHIPPAPCTPVPIIDSQSKSFSSKPDPSLPVDAVNNTFNIENKQIENTESSRSRALRIKRAKEEFLSRGPGGGTWSGDCQSPPTIAPSVIDDVVRWSKNKSRLSQVSCESDGSCEGILVSGEEQRQTFDTRLLVKSASAGMINIDSLSYGSILPESASNSSVPSGSSEQGAASKSRFGFSNIASRFRKVKMRRHKEKERDKMETVSTLCRQSLLVDIQKRKPTDKRDKVSSKSCPSSPVLQKRESNSSWSINPKRIFKPKGGST